MKKLKKIFIYFITTLILSTNLVYADSIKKDQAFFDAVKEYIMENYALEVTEDQLYDAAIKGMFDSLDPYSYYMTSEEYRSFMEDAKGEFAGIGATVGKNDSGFYIVSVISGSPADKAGLKALDTINSVDNKIVDIKIQTQELVKQIRGPKGTKVTLGITRNSKPLSIEITRDIIQITPIESKILKDDIAYLRIAEFNDQAFDDITTHINNLKKQGAKKVILDLRGNPGGSLGQVLKISNYFVPKGKVLEIRYKKDKPDIFYSTGDIKFEKTVVLIDGNTASAAEILAGAIQDTKSGILIGTTSYGKGVVQDLYPLKNGEAIKLTIAKYILPSGRSIDLKGLMPDEKVDYIVPDKSSSTDNQLDTAIKLIKQNQ